MSISVSLTSLISIVANKAYLRVFLLIYLFSISQGRRQVALQTVFVRKIREREEAVLV